MNVTVIVLGVIVYGSILILIGRIMMWVYRIISGGYRESKRRSIATKFNNLMMKHPDYPAYKKVAIEHANERSYSLHCGSIRDGGSEDRAYNIALDRNVRTLEERRKEYEDMFIALYYNVECIPELANIKNRRHWDKYSCVYESNPYIFSPVSGLYFLEFC